MTIQSRGFISVRIEHTYPFANGNVQWPAIDIKILGRERREEIFRHVIQSDWDSGTEFQCLNV